LNKGAVDRFLFPNPKVLEYFSRLLARRLATLARGEVVAKRTTVISVRGRPGLKGESFIATTLALLLARYSRREAVVVQTRRRGPGRRRSTLPGGLERVDDGAARLTLAVDGAGDEARQLEHPSALLARLSERFPFIVFDLG